MAETVTSIANGAWVADAASVWDTHAIPGPSDTALVEIWAVVLDGDGNGEVNVALVVIDGVGTLTLDGDRTIIGDLLLNAGTLADAGYDLSVDGDVEWGAAAGVYTATGAMILIGDGNLTWNETTYRINHLVQADGVATTLTGEVKVTKVTLGNGSFTGAQTLRIIPAANDFFVQDAAHTLDIDSLIIVTVASYSNGAIYGSSLATLCRIEGSDDTITFTGDVDIGTAELQIYGTSAGELATVDMTDFGLTAGDVTIGEAAANDKGGSLDLGGGNHKISGTLKGGDAANAANNHLNFGTGRTELAGLIDGDLIDNMLNTSGVVVGGTINNVDLTGQTPLLHLYPAVAGSGNTNVTELNLPVSGAMHTSDFRGVLLRKRAGLKTRSKQWLV